jgi:hypothetical protein
MSEQVLQQILQQLQGMNHHFDRIDQTLHGSDQRSDRMEVTLGEVKVTVLDRQKSVIRIDTVQQQQAVTIETMQKEQLRHGRVLEALSIKSLEHDAEIRELKRRK